MCWYTRLPRPRVPDYALHQIVWSYLPADYRRNGADRPFVYRVERDCLHVLSRYRLETDCRVLNAEIVTGRVYQFDLRCSPVRGTQRIGGAVRKRRDPYHSNDERRAWLVRRLDGCAEVVFASVFDRPLLSLKAPGKRAIHWPQCDMRGTLRVTDRAAFLQRLPSGIGGRGAWGHGLLYLPEVMMS